MVNIALDATPLSTLTGGVSRYTSELASALASEFRNDNFWLLSDQPFPWPAGSPRNLQCGDGAKSLLKRRWWLCGIAERNFAAEHRRVPRHRFRRALSSHAAEHPHASRPFALARCCLAHLGRPGSFPHAGLASAGVGDPGSHPTEAIRREAIAHFRLQPDRIVSVPTARPPSFGPLSQSSVRPISCSWERWNPVRIWGFW